MVCLIVCILIFRSRLVFKFDLFVAVVVAAALLVFGHGLHFDLVLGLTHAFNIVAFLYFL